MNVASLSLAYLGERSRDQWLIGLDNQTVICLTQALYRQLLEHGASTPSPKSSTAIVLVNNEPVSFLAGFFAACLAGHPVFLGNPHWTTQDYQQVINVADPCLILTATGWVRATATEGKPNLRPSPLPKLTSPLIMIPTGGSSGQVRFAIHTWHTLMASVEGFCQHFACDRVHSYCLLPLHHVSGLMQVLRSVTSGGRLAVQPYSTLLKTGPLAIDPAEWFVSLVPTQLQRLLGEALQFPTGQLAPDWLATFRAVLVGGAPPWPELLATARHQGIPLAPTYGMTETASQVATLKPAEFLAGQLGNGRSLPHATITIRDEAGDCLPAGQPGTIALQTPSLCLGYWPDDRIPAAPTPDRLFVTDDIGILDADGYLHVIGRSSNKLITGGENVYAETVEAALLATGLVTDAYVLGVADPYWGERVAAVYVPANPSITVATLQAAICPHLSPYQQPKQWLATPALARNAQGKLDRPSLRQYYLPQLTDTR